ncbi:hypothetical protein IHV04_09300 [Bifidobacterium dentium]|uniref:hypothetical protein n=1 Tax=Bifidobacterium dentium TaxID=1689 RepID=UPI0018C2FD86|nr:hypothetical protein [Bifidobacterium dentium]MBF9702794.1 hypothetical protein [Bifidobacterium dentium]
MPSGAAGNQMRAKYAPINRGTIRYGNDHDSGHHIQPETWSARTGIDLDRLLHEERAYISRMRHATPARTVRSGERQVYETLVSLYVDGRTPSAYAASQRLHMGQHKVRKIVEGLKMRGLLVNAGTGRGGFLPTDETPDWDEGTR